MQKRKTRLEEGRIRSNDGEEIIVKKEKDKEEIKDDFYPQCFRIYLDISTINVNNLINELSKMSNIIFSGVTIICFLNNGFVKKDLTNILAKKITPEFYCEEIKPEQCTNQSDIVSVFFKENYERNFAEYIEVKKRKELL